MTLPHMTQKWLTEVLQTTTPQGKCPPCGPVQGNGPQGSVVRACDGIVSKRLGSPYRWGRTDHWVKVKNPKAPAVTREAEEVWGR